MAKTPTAVSEEFTMLYVTQAGPYQGQQLLVRAEQLNDAIADGWGLAVTDAVAPNDAPVVRYGDPPQSYFDFLDDALRPGKPPLVTAIAPGTAEIGSADFTLTVTGSGFADGDKINFNGGDEVTTFMSDSELTTIVKPSLAGAAISVPIRVSGAGGSSNAMLFSFVDPPPEPEE